MAICAFMGFESRRFCRAPLKKSSSLIPVKIPTISIDIIKFEIEAAESNPSSRLMLSWLEFSKDLKYTSKLLRDSGNTIDSLQ